MTLVRKSRCIAGIALPTVAAALTLGGTLTAQAQPSGVQTIFTPSYDAGYTNPGVMYPRALTLQNSGDANGAMLTTWENYTDNPVFPIYQSTDSGATWSEVGQVTDTVNGYGMRWQPQLYELPAPLGALAAGTLLASGVSVPADESTTEMLLFASTDQGGREFLSSVAFGNRAEGNSVYEPFLLLKDGELIVYYSDERDPDHSQLVHQVTTDGVSWGPVVDDVAESDPAMRPGMSTVAQISGDRWILTYEVCNHPSGGCPVHYKIASDPENFNAETGRQMILDGGTEPCCQPYVVWTPNGGPDGTIVMSNGGSTALAVNTAGGDVNSWRAQESAAPGGYSRSLMLMADGNSVMTVTAGYRQFDSLNQVQLAIDQVVPDTSTNATSR